MVTLPASPSLGVSLGQSKKHIISGRQAHKRLMEGGGGERAHHGVEATGPAGIKTWHGSLPSSLPSLPSLHPPQVHIIADTGVELTPGQ